MSVAAIEIHDSTPETDAVAADTANTPVYTSSSEAYNSSRRSSDIDTIDTSEPGAARERLLEEAQSLIQESVKNGTKLPKSFDDYDPHFVYPEEHPWPLEFGEQLSREQITLMNTAIRKIKREDAYNKSNIDALSFLG